MTDPFKEIEETKKAITDLANLILQVLSKSKENSMIISYAAMTAFLNTLVECDISFEVAKKIFKDLGPVYKKMVKKNE